MPTLSKWTYKAAYTVFFRLFRYNVVVIQISTDNDVTFCKRSYRKRVKTDLFFVFKIKKFIPLIVVFFFGILDDKTRIY